MTAEQRSPFGELLKQHRLAAGLTQEALAERAGLSVRGLSDLECERTGAPRHDTLALLIDALDLPPHERSRFTAAARRRDSPARTSSYAAISQVATPLVGRLPALQMLEAFMAGTGAPLLLLAGEPGIGKTRLLQEVVAGAVARGMTVLAGGCSGRGGQSGYAPLLDALQHYVHGQPPGALRAELDGCAPLVHLLPELAGRFLAPPAPDALPPEQQRRLLFVSVTRFLDNIAGPAGTLMILDDLQWAGSDALDLLAALVRAGEVRGTVRIVAAYRDTDVRNADPLALLLNELAPCGLAARLHLDPLLHSEAEQLLHTLLSGVANVPSGVVQRVLQRAGGIPFFLVSYAQGLSALPRDETPDAVPWDLRQGVRQRVAALPPAAREVLALAALAGREASRSLLIEAAGQAVGAVVDALDELCLARLLAADGDGYHFVHDVIREVVEADLGAARRAALHGRIATTLERQPGTPPIDALAYHYAHSDGGAQAAHYLELAADQAADQHANATAEGYYRQLVALLDRTDPAHAARAREKLGSILRTMGRYDEALDALERATAAYRAAGDRERLVRVAARVGRVHAERGTPSAGVERLWPDLDVLDPPTAVRPRDGLAALYAAQARLFYACGRYTEQLSAADRGAQLAGYLGDERVLAEAEWMRGLALVALSRLAEAHEILERAVSLARVTGDLDTLCHALNLLGCIHEGAGEFALTRSYTDRAHETARRYGDPALIAYLTSRRGMNSFFMGDWTRARADFEQAVSQNRALGTPSWGSMYPLLDLGRLLVATGDWDDAARCLEEGRALAERGGDLQALRVAQAALAERDLLAGEPRAAHDRLAPLCDRPGLEESGVTTFVLPRLAWALAELGDAGGAEAIAEQALRRARATGDRVTMAGVMRVRAIIAVRRRAWERGRQALDEGLSLTRRMPYPYEEARLLVQDGFWHGAREEWGAAERRLREALTIFQRLGARPHLSEVERRLAGWPRTATVAEITDAHWERIRALLPPPSRGRGRPRADDRRTLEAILYVRRTGCAWGALPDEMGDEATAHRRLRQWQATGLWNQIEAVLQAPATM